MSDPLHNEFAPGSIEAKDLAHMLHPATNLADHHRNGPAVHQRAEGVYLWDNKGKQYIEGMAGLWCTALGYGEEELVRAAEQQLRKLSYSQLFASKTHEPGVLLAEKLKAMVPFDAGRVFFGLSGSDANDTQMKLMWYYHNVIGKPERKKIISRRSGYHGVTVASGSLTGLAPFHAHFDLPIPGVLHTSAPYYYREARQGETEDDFTTRLANELDDLIQAEGPETIAAFIAEPVMGVAGVVVPPDGYHQKIQEVLRRHRVFFIDDEVICGFGRTGQPFGAQALGIEPTTMTVAKALSSAYLPISAVLIPEFMYEPFVEASGEVGTFGHGFTYSGHPVCAAVALRCSRTHGGTRHIRPCRHRRRDLPSASARPRRPSPGRRRPWHRLDRCRGTRRQQGDSRALPRVRQDGHRVHEPSARARPDRTRPRRQPGVLPAARHQRQGDRRDVREIREGLGRHAHLRKRTLATRRIVAARN